MPIIKISAEKCGHTLDGAILFWICPKCYGLLYSCPDPACNGLLHHSDWPEDCEEDISHEVAIRIEIRDV